MNKLILLLLLFSIQSQAAEKISIEEKMSIDLFASTSGTALSAARACLVELKINKNPGLKCDEYNNLMVELNNYYKKVNKIDPKKRHAAVANNNEWYAAFIEFERLEFVIKKINQHGNDYE